MLSNESFKIYCSERKLKDETVSLIDKIRNSPPERKVRSNGQNVCGTFASGKMGFGVQFESHTLELAALLTMENDPSVLEFYDQPNSMKINYDKNGRNLGQIYVPDFFVIRNDWIGWEEWKTEEDLIKISEKNPARYVRDINGKWYSPPAEEFASKYGLSFCVRSSSELNWTYIRNVDFLQDYYKRTELVDAAKQTLILEKVKTTPGITLLQLIQSGENRYKSDDIFVLLISGKIYINIEDQLLPEPQYTNVYIDRETYKAYKYVSKLGCKEEEILPQFRLMVGECINWDGSLWSIINAGETSISLMSSEKRLSEIPIDMFTSLIAQEKIKAMVEFNADPQNDSSIKNELEKASPNDFRIANYRFEMIQALKEGQLSNYKDAPTPRNVRDWMKKYREAERLYGNGYLGLLPKDGNKGNRTRKIPQDTIRLMDEFIDSNYADFKQKNKLTVFGQLVVKCEQDHVIAPTYKTFANAIKKRSLYELSSKRKGKKAAYNLETFYYELSRTTPRHGDRPFHIGHIDHTLLDIQLVCSETGKNLGKPWATFMSDAYSRKILAVYLTFDPPSYRSCMMVIRECVRRYQRLPKFLVVDNAKEFESIYFDTLLNRYRVSKKKRPYSKPRFGSVCERLFGTTNTRFIDNLKGNTQVMKNVRQVTKFVNPVYHAVWSLSDLYEYLCIYAYEVYDQINHPSLGLSPMEKYLQGIKIAGFRDSTIIPYNQEFFIYTLPTTRKGTAKLDRNNGIKINYIYYWTDEFKEIKNRKEPIPVRFDPFNIGIAYAFINGRWVHCLSQYNAELSGKTVKEILLISEEIKKRYKNHQKNLCITARMIANFIDSAEEHEKVMIQRLKDNQTKQVLILIEGGFSKNSPIYNAEISNKEECFETNSKNDLTFCENESNMETHSFESFENEYYFEEFFK